MRERGDQPPRQRLWRRSRAARPGAARAVDGAPTGVFSAVGAEPRSSWTEPGDAVIPNPSVDPSTRSWVDPDVVPGVLGPPQANPTQHGDLPAKAEASAPSSFAEALRAGGAERHVSVAPSNTGLLNRFGVDGQTGPIDLVRDPRTRLVGALVAVVVAVLLLGRIGDLVSPGSPTGPRMGVGAETGSQTVTPPTDAPTDAAPVTPPPGADATTSPQLVVIGVGGRLSAERVRRWEDVADQTDARFTFFPSITDLLGPVGIDRYLPPGPDHARSPAPVATGDDDARRHVSALAGALAAGGRAGHEVAAGLGPADCPGAGSGEWTAADWSSELGQLRSVGAHPADYNAWGAELPDLFAGGLHGAVARCAPATTGGSAGPSGPTALGSALVEADLTWVMAEPASTGRTAPAHHDLGLWNFSPAVDLETLEAPTLETELTGRLEATMAGDRAPFVLNVAPRGAQPDSAEHALASFAQNACGRSDVRCVTFSEAARQLDADGARGTG